MRGMIGGTLMLLSILPIHPMLTIALLIAGAFIAEWPNDKDQVD